jgi:hypothetical protein
MIAEVEKLSKEMNLEKEYLQQKSNQIELSDKVSETTKLLRKISESPLRREIPLATEKVNFN